MIARRARLGAAAALLVLAASPAAGQDVSAARPAALPLAGQADGGRIAGVSVRLRIPSGDAERDAAATAAAERAVGPMADAPFSEASARSVLAGLVGEASITDAEYYFLQSDPQSGLRLMVEIDAAGPAPRKLPAGVLLGDLAAFPTLYESDRTLVSAIAGAGTGLYSDSDAWFGAPEVFLRGNPLAGHLPGRRTTWNEGYVELGFGGATRLGDSDLYAFGAVTGMFSWSHGQDIFTDDDRGYVDLEKAYGGILHASPDDPKNHFKLSVGRQTFTLDDGFLINAVRGSSNAGERGGVYLGPRLTNDFSVLALGRRGAVGYNLFYIDPNELESLESDSTFLGANGSYDFGRRFTADATFLTIPTSKTRYRLPSGATVPREGLNTVAAHVKWLPAPDAAGVWLEGELAHQFNPGGDVSAWAGYGSVGYIARGTRWTPASPTATPTSPATTRRRRLTSATTRCSRPVSGSGCRACPSARSRRTRTSRRIACSSTPRRSRR